MASNTKNNITKINNKINIKQYDETLKTILNVEKLTKSILLKNIQIICNNEYNNIKKLNLYNIKEKLNNIFNDLNIKTNNDFENKKQELNKLYNFNEVKKWASMSSKNDYKQGDKKDNKKEKLWGNKMINQKKNNQWTTVLGESFIYEILNKLGKNPKRPIKKEHYQPDWETDDAIYEVKTRTWTTSGTAGEKVYGTPLKYAEISKLYNKPLIIVCVAYQEYELKDKHTPILGENVREAQKKILEFYKKEFNITYMGCSELIKELETYEKLNNLKI